MATVLRWASGDTGCLPIEFVGTAVPESHGRSEFIFAVPGPTNSRVVVSTSVTDAELFLINPKARVCPVRSEPEECNTNDASLVHIEFS